MSNRFVSSARETLQKFQDFVARNESSTPVETVHSAFQTTDQVSVYYVAYRWAQFIFHLLIMLGSLFEVGSTMTASYTVSANVHRGVKFYAKWFLYMTHWGVVLNVVESFLGVVITSVALKNRNNPTPNSIFGIPLEMARFYRYAFGVALNMSAWITFGFWALIYNPHYYNIDLITVAQHGFGTILLLLDLVVVKFPYKLSTGFFTVLIGVMYEQMLIGHYLLGGLDRYQDRSYVYEVQDWSKPLAASAVVGSATIIIISFNFLLWGIGQVKRHFAEAVRSRGQPV